MNEHRIRLRAGWVCEQIDSAGSPLLKVSLPGPRVVKAPGRLRLSRSFGKPTLRGHEAVWLEIDHAHGLVSATLNQVVLPATRADRLWCEIDQKWLVDRNLLVLEVDFRGDETAPDGPWGAVSILIREPANHPEAQT